MGDGRVPRKNKGQEVTGATSDGEQTTKWNIKLSKKTLEGLGDRLLPGAREGRA